MDEQSAFAAVFYVLGNYDFLVHKNAPLECVVYNISQNGGVALEDKKIVQLLFERAENAISELNIRFGRQLYRIACNILENTQDAKELGRAIDRFLDLKSRENRYIFLRRYWFGDDVKEIAKELQMQENAVFVRLNRMRSSLKEYLKKEGYLYEAE